MADWMAMFGVFLGGMLLGCVFFGGLYWTTGHVLQSGRPGLLLVASMLVRYAVALAGFYWLISGDPVRAGVALAGFVVARWVLVRKVEKITGGRSRNEAH